jgi:hypothetical protein
VINTFPLPHTIKDLQEVCERCRCHRPPPDGRPLRWQARQTTIAVDSCHAGRISVARAALSSTCCLDLPATGTELSLGTDASASHVGTVLQQRQLGQPWRPLGFFSSKLDSPQQRYSPFDKELLGVYPVPHHSPFLIYAGGAQLYHLHGPPASRRRSQQSLGAVDSAAAKAACIHRRHTARIRAAQHCR